MLYYVALCCAMLYYVVLYVCCVVLCCVTLCQVLLAQHSTAWHHMTPAEENNDIAKLIYQSSTLPGCLVALLHVPKTKQFKSQKLLMDRFRFEEYG